MNISAANLALTYDSTQSVLYSDLGYEPLPIIEERNELYFFSSYHHAVLPMEEEIKVGFGRAYLAKNNEFIYIHDEMTASGNCLCMTVARAEELAEADPKNDWRIHLIAPLSDCHYQRQGRQNWVLYEKGAGFA